MLRRICSRAAFRHGPGATIVADSESTRALPGQIYPSCPQAALGGGACLRLLMRPSLPHRSGYQATRCKNNPALTHRMYRCRTVSVSSDAMFPDRCGDRGWPCFLCRAFPVSFGEAPPTSPGLEDAVCTWLVGELAFWQVWAYVSRNATDASPLHVTFGLLRTVHCCFQLDAGVMVPA